MKKTFDQITPVLGSGPGLIFEICKSFEKELMKLSLGEDLSRKLVSELFKGSAELSLGQEKSFSTLADEVSSPGGITEKMLETYKKKILCLKVSKKFFTKVVIEESLCNEVIK